MGSVNFSHQIQKNTEKFNDFVGTPWYVAPEIVNEDVKKYDERVDYWSAGVTLYVMLTARPPFNSLMDSNLIVYENIKDCRYDMCNTYQWSKYSEGIKSIIRRFLVVDPNKRLTVFEALNDPYFVQVERRFLCVGRTFMTQNVVAQQKNFRTTSRMQREVLKMMVSINDDTDQIKYHRYLFFCLDYLSNGIITKHELKAFFEEVNEAVDDTELEEIMKSIMLTDKNYITYTEFIAATIETSFYQEDKHLMEAFNIFDIDQTGVISYSNIKQCFSRRGYKLKDEEILGMLKDFEIDKDKEISLFEFLVIMKLQNSDKRLGDGTITTKKIRGCPKPEELVCNLNPEEPDNKCQAHNNDRDLDKESSLTDADSDCSLEITEGCHVYRGKRYKLLKQIKKEIDSKISSCCMNLVEIKNTRQTV